MGRGWRHGVSFAAALLMASAPLRAEADFPVEVEHIYGTAVIEAEPQRVVSLSFIGHDFLLALGVVPHGLRSWYGGHPYGVWPWAQEALGDAEPIEMQGEIDIERIALMQPDLIIAQWSGMKDRDYALLSQIAPTIGPAVGQTDYSSPWKLMLRRIAQATGRTAQAEEIITRLEGRFAEARAAHPDWSGATATMAWPGNLGAYTRQDVRGKFLDDLGFDVPESLMELPGGNTYYKPMPDEDMSPLDVDALIWLDTGGTAAQVNALPLRAALRVHQEGREVFADPLLAGALSHSSPLSLDYALDNVVPLLEQAMDGDPATPVASSVAAGIAP